jgi:hypothetical protein
VSHQATAWAAKGWNARSARTRDVRNPFGTRAVGPT